MKQFLQWMKLKEKSYAEFHDTEKSWIPQNSAEFDEFRNMEFRGIHGNSVFSTEYTEF
jgi:hypothetical protein